MDKKTVSRLFDLRYQDATKSKPAFHYFVMQSVVDGEYGRIVFQCVGQIDSPGMEIHSSFFETSGESMESLFDLRIQETLFFLKLLTLFHPKNYLIDEVPFPSASES